MKPRAFSRAVCFADVDRLLKYNKWTGDLTWKVNRSRLAKAGSLAGTLADNGTVMVGLQGHSYPATHLIWMLVTGGINGEFPVYPKRLRILVKDGDQQNLRWNNLVEQKNNLSKDHDAVYQRRRRRILKLTRDKIQSDPFLARKYAELSEDQAALLFDKIRSGIIKELVISNRDPAWEKNPLSDDEENHNAHAV